MCVCQPGITEAEMGILLPEKTTETLMIDSKLVAAYLKPGCGPGKKLDDWEGAMADRNLLSG